LFQSFCHVCFCHVNNVNLIKQQSTNISFLFTSTPLLLLGQWASQPLHHSLLPLPQPIMEETPVSSPPSRRVMSGSDAGVTYHADDTAQLVPPPTSRSDSSHHRESSRGPGRRRSNFSQQISATRYGTSHMYRQHADKADNDVKEYEEKSRE
jgi:hypothetical protein